jgi:hypothetical protein
MQRFIVFSSLFLFACATTEGSDAPEIPDDTEESEPAVQIDATIRILDAMSGSGVADVNAESAHGDTATTDDSGSAVIPVHADSTFEILLQKNGSIDHLLFGPTGTADFDYITFMATEALVGMVTGMLGTTPDSGTGLMVVGIDYDNLSPAVGASAALNADHDEPWVLKTTGPAFGDTIPAGAMGMVAFPGLQPGMVEVSVEPPSGAECTAYPGGGTMPDVPVLSEKVTVVTFHCR